MIADRNKLSVYLSRRRADAKVLKAAEFQEILFRYTGTI